MGKRDSIIAALASSAVHLAMGIRKETRTGSYEAGRYVRYQIQKPSLCHCFASVEVGTGIPVRRTMITLSMYVYHSFDNRIFAKPFIRFRPVRIGYDTRQRVFR